MIQGMTSTNCKIWAHKTDHLREALAICNIKIKKLGGRRFKTTDETTLGIPDGVVRWKIPRRNIYHLSVPRSERSKPHVRRNRKTRDPEESTTQNLLETNNPQRRQKGDEQAPASGEMWWMQMAGSRREYSDGRRERIILTKSVARTLAVSSGKKLRKLLNVGARLCDAPAPPLKSASPH